MSESAHDAVAADVAETVAPGSVETHTHESPSNADIMARLDDIAGQLASSLTSQSGADATNDGDGGDVEEPGNGEVIRDKSPASKPWTHKRILK